MSNPCRLDNTTQNKIAYAIGYENGRADAIDEVLQIVHNVYANNFYCTEDYCPNGKKDCDDCLYMAIQKNLKQLKEQKNE